MATPPKIAQPRSILTYPVVPDEDATGNELAFVVSNPVFDDEGTLVDGEAKLVRVGSVLGTPPDGGTGEAPKVIFFDPVVVGSSIPATFTKPFLSTSVLSTGNANTYRIVSSNNGTSPEFDGTNLRFEAAVMFPSEVGVIRPTIPADATQIFYIFHKEPLTTEELTAIQSSINPSADFTQNIGALIGFFAYDGGSGAQGLILSIGLNSPLEQQALSNPTTSTITRTETQIETEIGVLQIGSDDYPYVTMLSTASGLNPSEPITDVQFFSTLHGQVLEPAPIPENANDLDVLKIINNDGVVLGSDTEIDDWCDLYTDNTDPDNPVRRVNVSRTFDASLNKSLSAGGTLRGELDAVADTIFEESNVSVLGDDAKTVELFGERHDANILYPFEFIPSLDSDTLEIVVMSTFKKGRLVLLNRKNYNFNQPVITSVTKDIANGYSEVGSGSQFVPDQVEPFTAHIYDIQASSDLILIKKIGVTCCEPLPVMPIAGVKLNNNPFGMAITPDQWLGILKYTVEPDKIKAGYLIDIVSNYELADSVFLPADGLGQLTDKWAVYDREINLYEAATGLIEVLFSDKTVDYIRSGQPPTDGLSSSNHYVVETAVTIKIPQPATSEQGENLPNSQDNGLNIVQPPPTFEIGGDFYPESGDPLTPSNPSVNLMLSYDRSLIADGDTISIIGSYFNAPYTEVFATQYVPETGTGQADVLVGTFDAGLFGSTPTDLSFAAFARRGIYASQAMRFTLTYQP